MADHSSSAQPDSAIKVKAGIEPERGRWVVYLDVMFWELENETDSIKVVRRRIADYPTQRRAEMAASFFERGADREGIVTGI